MTAEFLALMSWNPEVRVLSFPQDHPVLGWTPCLVRDCGKSVSQRGGLCIPCAQRHAASGVPLEEFTAQTKGYGPATGVGNCGVAGCARPWVTSGAALCQAHAGRRRTLGLTLPEFLAHPNVVGLPSAGPCRVAACPRARDVRLYCVGHYKRWKAAASSDPDLDEQLWRATTSAIAENQVVSLRGLRARVVTEVLYGVQQRAVGGTKLTASALRTFCDLLRRRQVTSMAELPTDGISPRHFWMRNTMLKEINRLTLTPESQRHHDVWDATAFGHNGTIKFTGISQPWLREAVKRWAFEDLPRRRGDGVRSAVQCNVNSAALLSDSLRLQRDDRGELPWALGRTDITAFCNRMAYLQAEGTVTYATRRKICGQVKKLLDWTRTSGLTRRGQLLQRLPGDFALTRSDIPARPDDDTVASRDLPAEILRQLCQALPTLEAASVREIRIAVELMIDTGRRPDEVCQLPWDCLTRDDDGKPVLIYDNFKSQRFGRRLPIPEATATLITEQKTRVQQRFPDTALSKLKLLPTPLANPHGTKSINDEAVSERHRSWVNRLPDLRLADGTVFDKAKIVPYAYRHTYAQRHADAGVPVDVLRDLMNHKLLDTSQKYYRVGEQRRREAVDRVAVMQFDRHGDRIWRTAKALLDSEHVRRAVGEVAVPLRRVHRTQQRRRRR